MSCRETNCSNHFSFSLLAWCTSPAKSRGHRSTTRHDETRHTEVSTRTRKASNERTNERTTERHADRTQRTNLASKILQIISYYFEEKCCHISKGIHRIKLVSNLVDPFVINKKSNEIIVLVKSADNEEKTT